MPVAPVAETAVAAEEQEGRLRGLFQRSKAVAAQVRTFLRIYDALFLRVRPDAPRRGPLQTPASRLPPPE